MIIIAFESHKSTMSISSHRRILDGNQEISQIVKVEAKVDKSLASEHEPKGSFFRGCVIWSVISIPLWAWAIWRLFFR
jgi:hypothetical protein